MGKLTEKALVARGVDTNTANTIASKGLTLQSLKQLPLSKLVALGLRKESAEVILSEARPPIPDTTLHSLLIKSKRTCCICRDPSKPIIVHHIDEWSVSRSHEESNLIVLCLEHHDQAHTKKEISQKLSKKELRASKDAWERDVKLLDAKAILKLKQDRDYSRWDWINLPRLFEIVAKMKVKSSIPHLRQQLFQDGYINKEGFIANEKNWPTSKKKGAYFIDFGDGMYISYYLSDLVDQVLSSTPVIDITPLIESKLQITSVLAEGDFIVAQLPFYFANVNQDEKGSSQHRKSYYRGHGIRIEYVFNAWNCLSSSARFDAMTGRKVKTIFARVMSIAESEGELLISVSCLAAGTAFKTHQARP
ncbi:hypothetical protein QF205_16295 [Luteimonas composti]|uniref:HNH endonuclease n=1 Tax=Luteimonas composti TaxID=398257 RepID=A0ABT6MVH0_9GAMM|nr:hypothetical protein [Luteimonas composti]MDH7454619.1 hypothetical protein [Luteimonas composti]